MKPPAKITLILAASLSLMASPALAQMGGKRGPSENKKAEPAKPVVDEKAYKAALEKIPEPKEKYDPWGQVRTNPPTK